MHGIGSYQKVQNETAGPERQLVLLFEAAQRWMLGGASALDGGATHPAMEQLGKASDIVLELHRCLDRARAPELAGKLEAVYEYVLIELTKAKAYRKAQHARNAERALAPLVAAFQKAVGQVLSQRGAGARP